MRLNLAWLNQILVKVPEESWQDIFLFLQSLVEEQKSDIKTSYRTLETEISHLDHMLSNSAWDLWQQFAKAPKGSALVKTFWQSTVGPKAVLILDSLSIREVPAICSRLQELGLSVKELRFAGSEVPSETDIYASALGLNGRADLAKKPIPKKFFIPENDVYADTFKKLPFDVTATKIRNEKNLFIWHGWPDDALHDWAKVDDAFNRFIDHVKEQIESEGFKQLILHLTQGRELLITSDHGYCDTSSFTMAQNTENAEIKTLGHTRAKRITEQERNLGLTIPPATVEMYATASPDLYRLALGRRRPSDKGFPALTHGGLSILECTVPLITVCGKA